MRSPVQSRVPLQERKRVASHDVALFLYSFRSSQRYGNVQMLFDFLDADDADDADFYVHVQ